MNRPNSGAPPVAGLFVAFVFSVATLTSACLLFVVQPMFAKMALPLLGGTPSVWNTAMVFFQAALLSGYAYAHFSVQKLGVARQRYLHAALLLAPLAVLPIAIPPGTVPPAVANPNVWLLGLMAACVGLPFFVVSATAPMLQRWFAATGHRSAGDPYFLYAASNAGSMVALVSYPLWIEPRWTLHEQARAWAVGYEVLIVLMLAAAWLVRVRYSAPPADPEDGLEPSRARLERPTTARRFRWLALAMVPSSLMLAVTTFLTTDVASVPLLWVGPLAIYLLTFILVFAKWQPVPAWVYRWSAPFLVLALLTILNANVLKPIWMTSSLATLTFFCVCMVCHGELARDRPSTDHLTEFYLLLSLGGVLGGAFCALVAPVAFKSVLEYPLTLVAATFLLPGTKRLSGFDWAVGAAWAIVVAVAATIGVRTIGNSDIEPEHWKGILSYLPAAVLCLMAVRVPARFGLCALALAVAGMSLQPWRKNLDFEGRSFFGVLRVRTDSQGTRWLYHGTTLHGYQSTKPGQQRFTTSYYTRSGPVGQLFEALDSGPRDVAVVGLGAGTMATYSRPGDSFTFYEIDPEVVRIATNPRYFTYISQAEGKISFRLGDARLQLQATQAMYDVIVLDAYSSDAVPIHLITKQAVQLYFERLKPQGVLAFHISNRNLNLEPVLGAIARSLGLVALDQFDASSESRPDELAKTPSEWVILGRDAVSLRFLDEDPLWHPARTDPRVGVWTDDFSSILPILTAFQ